MEYNALIDTKRKLLKYYKNIIQILFKYYNKYYTLKSFDLSGIIFAR